MNKTKTASLEKSKATFIGWIICILGAVFYCYEYLLRIQPSVMVPELMRQFHISANRFSDVVTLYYLAYTPMQALVGIITDLYGPRYILTFAVFVCALGSFLFGVADNLYLASLGRFLIGYGSAFAFVSALKLASIWLPFNRFALFTGIVTALGMIGGMVGDIGLTHLVATIGARYTIYASALLGAILIPIMWLVIGERQTALNNQQSSKTTYRETFSALLTILRNPQVWITGFVGCILYLSLSVFAELWGIPFLKGVYHLSPSQAAFTNSFIFLGWLIGAPLTGWISDKIQRRRAPLMFGYLFSIASIMWIIYVPTTPIFIVDCLLLIFGICSSVEIVCFAVARENSPKQVSGAVVSFVNLLVMFGGLMFQPLVGKILDMYWLGSTANEIRIYDAHSYQVALTVLPLALILGLLLTFWLHESFAQSLEEQ